MADNTINNYATLTLVQHVICKASSDSYQINVAELKVHSPLNVPEWKYNIAENGVEVQFLSKCT